MRVSVLIGWLALASTVLVGCSATVERPPPSVPPAPIDQGIRAVRMNTGVALTYVQPETASQILCQILDKDRWERILDDRVSRHPSGAPDPTCMIAGEHLGLTLRLSRPDTAFRPATTIGGRPAAALPDSPDDVAFRVALTDPAPAPAVPLLDLSVPYASGLDPPAERELAVRVLTEIVPLLTREGDRLPPIDSNGTIAYTPTPLTRGGQIVDLPQPVQALQLCTAAETVLHTPPTRVTGTAQCELSTPDGPVTLALRPSTSAPSYPDKLAGRPAHTAPATLIRLRDDAQVDLAITARNPTPLAEQLVPLLLS